MISRVWTAVAALATMLAVGASSMTTPSQRVFAVSDKPELVDHFPDHPVLFPGGVKAYRDVSYQQLPGYTPQIVDIYIPATKGPHPLLLYIHGGAWVGGHTRHAGALANFPAVLASLAAEGFIVASLEYRLAAEAKFPAQLQDAKAALRFLRDHAAKYRIDPTRVGIWGGSAGGHLAAITALTCHDTSLDPAAAKDVCATAAVIWYGAFDFVSLRATKGVGGERLGASLLGCVDICTSEQLARVSPASYVDAKDPSFLLIHGTDDKVLPVVQTHEFEALLKAAGVPVQAIYIPGVDHSFIGTTPEQTRAATLYAVNETFDFFHAKLGVARR